MGRKKISDSFNDDQKLDRLKTVHYCFTQHDLSLFDDYNLIRNMLDSQKEKKVSYMRFQLEQGKETDKKHYQGYLQLSIGVKWARSHLLSYSNCLFLRGAHIEPCKGSSDDNINYVSKESTAIMNTVFEWGESRAINRSSRGRFDKGNTDNIYCHMKEDALVLNFSDFVSKYAFLGHNLQNMQNLREYYNLYKPKYTFDIIGTYGQYLPWQQKFIDVISIPPDDRHIIHIFDPICESGKTKMCKQLSSKGWVQIDNGKSENMFYMPRGENVYMNLPKATKDVLNYTAIEAIKDGKFISTKYHVENVMYGEIHFVIFSNYMLNYESMDPMRWIIYEIKENLELVDITKEAIDFSTVLNTGIKSRIKLIK